jgi:hypothetical protein
MAPVRDFSTMTPRAIEAYLRDVILKALGDKVENASGVYARNGYYTVSVNLSSNSYVQFSNFRKRDAGKIAQAIRGLK